MGPSEAELHETDGGIPAGNGRWEDFGPRFSLAGCDCPFEPSLARVWAGRWGVSVAGSLGAPPQTLAAMAR